MVRESLLPTHNPDFRSQGGFPSTEGAIPTKIGFPEPSNALVWNLLAAHGRPYESKYSHEENFYE